MKTLPIGALLIIVSHGITIREQQPRAYLLHEGCGTQFGEGMGRDMQQLRGFVDVAVRNNLRLVCNPEDFTSNDHAVGFTGFLFGCHSFDSVQGDLASMKELDQAVPAWHDRKINVQLVNPHTPSRTFNWTQPQPGSLYFIPRSAGCDWLQAPDGSRKMNPNTGNLQINSWGEGWKWFRYQYATALALDPSRQQSSCWANIQPGKTRVAVHLRRGDDYWMPDGHAARQYGAEAYIDILKRSLMSEIPGLPPIQEGNLVIHVIAETTFEREPSLKLFQSELPSATVVYRLGDAPTGAATVGEARRFVFVQDLDCLQGADILLLSGSSKFSQIAAVIQKEGGRSVQIASDEAPPLMSMTTDTKPYEHLRKDQLAQPPLGEMMKLVSLGPFAYQQSDLPSMLIAHPLEVLH
mmetsp:Transcript_81168/g.143127  ORF Transcript_81168/g.143127 Transcript_81168/m.143127 type:complete len:408 (+) Transcript_81168:39-1262(+)|eukprot:CAMPEP_0197625506 /NCGR_PEP_ID=MMETSP1338-20131121/4857_1 /TAXON_ID=43686 ORGANISM="Pelagodinium beii, Strain RCC1491" /NCGR_SAMPLE_ID=MMETSP1338 /ASSEMBLY_ACC=CAM_ASM_000754 /LENGTH=407 /DNA_ID=CAMNT_0043195935 /DNA_START=39 /DNA_END=1262 /DNA_ORIENTATION=-